MCNIDIANLSVCPSVRDVPGLDENGLIYCHSFFHHMVVLSSDIFTNFWGGHPLGGDKYRCQVGIKILRFSTNKLLYLADDTR